MDLNHRLMGCHLILWNGLPASNISDFHGGLRKSYLPILPTASFELYNMIITHPIETDVTQYRKIRYLLRYVTRKYSIPVQLQRSAPIEMDNLKKTVVYWRTLRNNEIDHGDIWAYRMLPIMR